MESTFMSGLAMKWRHNMHENNNFLALNAQFFPIML